MKHRTFNLILITAYVVAVVVVLADLFLWRV